MTEPPILGPPGQPLATTGAFGHVLEFAEGGQVWCCMSGPKQQSLRSMLAFFEPSKSKVIPHRVPRGSRVPWGRFAPWLASITRPQRLNTVSPDDNCVKYPLRPVMWI